MGDRGEDLKFRSQQRVWEYKMRTQSAVHGIKSLDVSVLRLLEGWRRLQVLFAMWPPVVF